MEKKITKTEKYQKLVAILETVDHEDAEMLIEFANAEIAALARKAAKAKETAATKKAEIDELGQVVLSVLTAEPQTRDQVAEQIEGEDVTVAKVGARLNKLVAQGAAVKTEVAAVSASGKKTTRMAYALAEGATAEDEE